MNTVIKVLHVYRLKKNKTKEQHNGVQKNKKQKNWNDGFFLVSKKISAILFLMICVQLRIFFFLAAFFFHRPSLIFHQNEIVSSSLVSWRSPCRPECSPLNWLFVLEHLYYWLMLNVVLFLGQKFAFQRKCRK